MYSHIWSFGRTFPLSLTDALPLHAVMIQELYESVNTNSHDMTMIIIIETIEIIITMHNCAEAIAFVLFCKPLNHPIVSTF